VQSWALILVIVLLMVIPNFAFAQTDFGAVDCPPGTHEKAQSGGGIVCVDDSTGKVVNPSDYFSYQLGGETGVYIGIGVIVLIIIIGVGAAASRKGKSEVGDRKDFAPSVHKDVLRKQKGLCAICHEVSSSFHFDHIDEDHSNNDPSNCQALCPNCHDRKSRGLDD